MHPLWYYLAPPVTAIPGLWSRHTVRRLHARRSWRLGVRMLQVLIAAALLEVLCGYIPRVGVGWVRSLVVLGVAWYGVAWAWAVLMLAQRGHCHVPVVGADDRFRNSQARR